MKTVDIDQIKIAVIGLGYVGLPLARLLATRYPVVGYDTNPERIGQLAAGCDRTLEVTREALTEVLSEVNPAAGTGRGGLYCTDDWQQIRDCNFYIVTVPTPIDRRKIPDLEPLRAASQTVGRVIGQGDIVVYESTVYPGATREVCVPIIEQVSGLVFNRDFYAGYSPERINPGDREHTVDKIRKVVSGSTPHAARVIDEVYSSVIAAGTYCVSRIEVAEAAKVIENAQRDINIAFVNELKKILDRMDIDTNEVLAAASTKWNFLPFTPGLVGGHCIGVDPYYLAWKAQEIGYHPEIILAGRRINDSMGGYAAGRLVKQMIKANLTIQHAQVLILGITFKENCPDVRNTRVIDIIDELRSYDIRVTVCDPHADREQVEREYGLQILNEIPDTDFDAALVAVAHDEFRGITPRGKVIYRVREI